MTDPTQQDRLAALAARRAAGAPKADVPPIVESTQAASARALPKPKWPSSQRLAAAGMSAVSFAAMIVAMGPFAASADNDLGGTVGGDQDDAGAQLPTAPPVSIELTADGTPTDESVPTPEELAMTAGTALDGSALPVDPTASTPAVPGAPAATSVAGAPAPTAPAGTPAAAVPAAPSPAAAPATAAPAGSPAAPTTAPPVTAAPTTAPPVTAAPTTAPPVTAAPTTAPPTTAASGG